MNLMDVEGAFFNTNDFKLCQKKLGEGIYGKVYIAEHIKNHQQYAAKLINININETYFDGPEQKQFLQESLILRSLSHPSIVKFIGINFRSFSNPELIQPTIITEYLPNGSLKDNLNKERKSLSNHEWTSTKKYINLLGISDALRYLHERNIVHRDLKPENILIDKNFYPRVCDFGLSKCFESLSKSIKLTITGQFGTPLYLPPEILRGGNHYDQSVDVYAFGMIMYEIVSGKEPFSEFENISPFALIEKIKEGYRPKFSEFVTEEMQKLISRCWSDKPKERPTFNEIFESLSSDLASNIQRKKYFNEDLDKEEIQSFLDNLQKSRKKRSSQSAKADDEKIKLLKEVNELKAKLSEEQKKIDTFSNEKIAKLVDQLNQANNKNNEYQRKLRDSEDRLCSFNSELIKLRTENETLRKLYSTAKDERESFRIALEMNEQSAKELQAKQAIALKQSNKNAAKLQKALDAEKQKVYTLQANESRLQGKIDYLESAMRQVSRLPASSAFQNCQNDAKEEAKKTNCKLNEVRRQLEINQQPTDEELIPASSFHCDEFDPALSAAIRRIADNKSLLPVSKIQNCFKTIRKYYQKHLSERDEALDQAFSENQTLSSAFNQFLQDASIALCNQAYTLQDFFSNNAGKKLVDQIQQLRTNFADLKHQHELQRGFEKAFTSNFIEYITEPADPIRALSEVKDRIDTLKVQINRVKVSIIQLQKSDKEIRRIVGATENQTTIEAITQLVKTLPKNKTPLDKV